MREFKFRALDTQTKKLEPWKVVEHMVMWSFNHKPGGGGQDRYIFLQYTGLKDKNGVEIYEGDIVSYGGQWRSVVSFGEFQVYTEDDSYWCLGWRADDSELDPHSEPLGYIVIGNIYENPNLLEAK